jgi:hypothetical protein
MAVIRIQRPEGVTFEMYQAVQAKVGVEEDPPVGLILHSAGEVDGAVQIVDVWESEDAARRFGDERLFPAIKAVAGDMAPTGPPPDMQVYELKNLVMP